MTRGSFVIMLRFCCSGIQCATSMAAALALDHGLSIYPPPFAAEGQDLAKASRRRVPLSELHGFYADMARQTADVPDGGRFSITPTD
jgi:hypothetical protein